MRPIRESDFKDEYDYYEEYDDVFREILTKMINGDRTKIILKKIKPQMYQQALNEFMRYGKIMRYPVKYIEQWKDIVVRNTVFLDVNTMFYGHTSYFDVDTFNDYVLNTDETGESVSDWQEAWEYMEKKGYDEVLEDFMPKFSNGHDLISDYGLEPLKKVVVSLMQTQDPNQILVLINKALDISHQRSDLSEIFIEGGEASLDRISGTNETLSRIIKEEINYFVENDDYRGEHHAPSTDDAPLHDMTQTFPEDIYSSDAARMYGHYGDYRDQQAISIIQSARNKPNKLIKIYRAVPDVNHDLKAKLKPLLDIVNYHSQWNRFPMKNQIVYDLQDKYSIDDHSYDEQQKLILNDINKKIEELQSQQQEQIGINAGDWVTIVRDYAKEHGQSNLGNKFKIISKTVPAKTLYNEGNDIFEWGYQPNRYE
jgi:hypothetical protein